MKRILFLILPLLPYLATAQVAKDTVTVLTPAQITAASPNDTANIYFVIANAWRKANFDSIARYTRNRFQTLTLDSTHIAANGLSLQGTELTGTLQVGRGGTGLTTFTAANRIPYTTSATALTTSAGLTFDGTNFATSGTASATKFIPTTGGTATGNGMYLSAPNAIGFSTAGSERILVNASGNVSIGSTDDVRRLDVRLTDNTAYSATSDNGNVFNIFNATSTDNAYAAFRMGVQGLSGGAGVVNLYAIRNAAASGTFTIATRNSGTFAERIRLSSDGNLGIGTDNPQSRLQVNGISAFANGSAGAPSMTNTGNTDTGMWFPAADVVGFSTSGTERMRVKADGQVRFIPLGAAPGSPELGDVYYDSGTHKLRVYAKVGGTDQWVDLH